MYTLYSRYMDTNGYILIYLPGHPRAIGKWCEKYGIEKPPRGYWWNKKY